MNRSNPYATHATKVESRGWGLIDFSALGLWIAIPISVYIARLVLLPVFTDFEIALPLLTQYLLSVYAPFLLAAASLLIVVLLVKVPYGNPRRKFIWGATVLGLLVGAGGTVALLSPLFTLWRNLI